MADMKTFAGVTGLGFLTLLSTGLLGCRQDSDGGAASQTSSASQNASGEVQCKAKFNNETDHPALFVRTCLCGDEGSLVQRSTEITFTLRANNEGPETVSYQCAGDSSHRNIKMKVDALASAPRRVWVAETYPYDTVEKYRKGRSETDPQPHRDEYLATTFSALDVELYSNGAVRLGCIHKSAGNYGETAIHTSATCTGGANPGAQAPSAAAPSPWASAACYIYSGSGLCHEADQSSLPIGLGLLMDPHVHCVGSRLGRLDWSAS
jgi:hypothetical protein